MANPVASVRRIHERFGLPFDREALGRVRDYLVAHPRNRHGAHRYRLEDYGLSSMQVMETFNQVSELGTPYSSGTGAVPA